MSKICMFRIFAALMFLIIPFDLIGRNNFHLSVFRDRIYLLDGFEKTLTEYDTTANVTATISLKNINPSGFFDSFVMYDMFKSYAVDSFKNTVYLLDKDLALEKRSDIFAEHGIKTGETIFPVKYNSFLIASSENDMIFSVENNKLKEIIILKDRFKDFFADSAAIYVLKEQEVIIYSPEGIFRSRFSLKNYTSKFKKITAAGDAIYLLSDDLISMVLEFGTEIKNLPAENAVCFTADDKRVYYFNGEQLKIIRTGK